MKTLTMVRHAKSDWGNETITDILRPLNVRGYSDAQILARQMPAKVETPGLWVTSPAIRAYSTALVFAEAYNYDPAKFVINPKIYEATLKTLTGIVSAFPDEVNSIIMFGHNPGFTKFFNEYADAFADNIPTCGITCISHDCASWKEFLDSKCKTEFYLYPKEFR